MRSIEFITELRKKKVKEPVVQLTPYDQAYDHLTLVGEVQINQNGLSPYDSDD